MSVYGVSASLIPTVTSRSRNYKPLSGMKWSYLSNITWLLVIEPSRLTQIGTTPKPRDIPLRRHTHKMHQNSASRSLMYYHVPRDSAPKYLPNRNENMCPHTKTCTQILSSIIHNQKTVCVGRTTNVHQVMSRFKRWDLVIQWSVIWLYKEVKCWHSYYTTCPNLREHYVKWKRQEHALYAAIHMTFLGKTSL